MWRRTWSSRKKTAARQWAGHGATGRRRRCGRSLGERVLGRVTATDVHKPGKDELLVEPARCLMRVSCGCWSRRASIRSTCAPDHLQDPLRCLRQVLRARSCARPSDQYRRSGRRDRGAVDRRAGTQLTMRTFHIGGAASRAAAASNVEIRNKGTLRFHHIKTSSTRRDTW